MKSVFDEFKNMLKDPMTILLLFIFPIGVNLLLGFQFQNDVISHIPMAIVDQDNSVLSRMIVQQFQENDTFDVKYHLDNQDEVKTLLDTSKIGAGMIIPKNFYSDVMKLESPTILMVYDGSHISVASAAKTKATEILLTLRTGTLLKLIKAKLSVPDDVAQKIALAVQFTNRTLYNPAKSFKNFINPGFGAAAVQTSLALLAAAAIRQEELPFHRRKRILQLICKVLFYTIFGMISFLTSIVMQAGIFRIPFRGSWIAAIMLSLVFAAAISSFGLMISAWLKNKTMSVLINAIIFIPSTIMAGYTWPTLAMTDSYKTYSSLQPFSHYVDHLRDMYLKGISISATLTDIGWLTIFTAVALVVGCAGVCLLPISKDKNQTPLKEGAEIGYC